MKNKVKIILIGICFTMALPCFPLASESHLDNLLSIEEADKSAEDKKSKEQYVEFLEKHYGDSQMPQYLSEGPWYFYDNKLYIPGDKDGYYRIDIYGDSYEKVLLKDDSSEIFVDANILRLSCDTSSEDDAPEKKKSQTEKKRTQIKETFEYTFPDSIDHDFTEAEDFTEDSGDNDELENPEFSVEAETSPEDSEQEEPSQMGDSSDYIIENSASEYLSEAEVNALNLSKKELTYAKYEIYARKGCKFDSSEVQNYFNSKSWYNPTIEAEDFSDSLLNYYEIENLALLAKMERS